MIAHSSKSQLGSIRIRASLLLVALLALNGCSGPSAGEELSPVSTVGASSGTKTLTPKSDDTASDNPTPTEGAPAGSDNPASVTPSATEGAPAGSDNTATAAPSAVEEAPPASTPVPPPTPGSIHETVESRTSETKDPVGIEDKVTFDQQVTAEITELREIEKPLAGMPNEVPEPAVAITVKLTNVTADAVALDAVVVEVLDSAEAPGGRMTGDPYDPLSGTLAAGRTASGTYVYTMDKDRRDPISVVVTLNADEPVVLFQGPIR